MRMEFSISVILGEGRFDTGVRNGKGSVFDLATAGCLSGEMGIGHSSMVVGRLDVSVLEGRLVVAVPP